MAEQKKGASAKSTEKNSSLDLDIDKDFFTSSWKGMSVADDIEFDFGPVTKGKKTGFDFDKMDMDFNLDGDFGKISSFKVAMPDLDISSDSPKTENPRKRTKEVSAANGKIQGKNDSFDFQFDFDELDISFGSELMKGDKKSKKDQNKEETTKRSESEGSGTQLTDDIGASEEGIITQKLPAAQNLTISNTDISHGNVGEIDLMNENAPSNSVAIENCPLKSAEVLDEIVEDGMRTSPQKTTFTTREKSNHESSRPINKATSPELESYKEEAMVTTKETRSNLQEEASTIPSESNTSSGGGNIVYLDEPMNTMPPKNPSSSPRVDSEMNKYMSDDHARLSDQNSTEPAQGDLRLEHTSVMTASRQLVHDTQPIGEKQDSEAKNFPNLSNRCSETTADKSVPESDRETGVVGSKYFKRPVRDESHLQKMLISHRKHETMGGKRIGGGQLSHTDESRKPIGNDAQSGIKLPGMSRLDSTSPTRIEPIETESQERIQSINSTRNGESTAGTERRGKSLATSRIRNQDAKKGENIVEESEKNTKGLSKLSGHISPSNLCERTDKSSSQNIVDPRLPVSSVKSLQNTKKICFERSKTSPPNSGTRAHDLSRLKISSGRGSNPDLPKSRFLKDTSSSGNLGQIMELQGNIEAKISHSSVTKKQLSPAPILKRKTLEKSNADLLTLNPAKRLSPVHSGRLVEKQVFNHENYADNNTRNIISDKEIHMPSIAREVKMTKVEAPLPIDTESNLEKAEACTKELEDISSLLKKKNEEAKELLVRAIVNNNNLLMLNHPIYEEKISMVQKFAALTLSI